MSIQSCAAVLDFDHDVDLAKLPAHLADCLLDVKAFAVEVEPSRVTFRGGIFRFVSGWNVLTAFDRGEIVSMETLATSDTS